MAKHAFLSPSGASSWLKCELKPWLEKDLPDTGSEAADEGTAAHELAARCLVDGDNAIDHVGAEIRVGDSDWEVTDEMAGYVQQYLDYVRELPLLEMMVEQMIHIVGITGEDEASGTADVVGLDGNTLHIADLKFGYGYVSAKGNAQLRTYASGAVRQFATLFDISRVVLHICQPRIASFESETLTIEELLDWEAETRKVAERILAGPAGLVATPGESQCKFCRAKGSCPALRDHALAVVRVDDFTNLDAKIALLTNDDLAYIGPRLELIHDWCNGVRAEMERRQLGGQEITGWKVVQGKKGNRAWSDQEEAENWLVPILGERAYTKKIVSPTQAEKLLKKDFIVPRASLVTQSEGRPAVVPVTDKRPALSLSCDFQPVEEE